MPNYTMVNGSPVAIGPTADEVDNILSVIPLSRYGATGQTSIPTAISGTSVLVGPTEGVKTFIAGRYTVLEQTLINVVATMPDPFNKTLYVYVELSDDGVVGYSVKAVPTPDTVTSMFVGNIVTGASDITSVSIEVVTRVDTYRLSPTPRGSAIPVSTGLPTGTGDYAWSSN